MKRFLYTLLLLFVFAGCKKDDDKPSSITFDQDSAFMTYGESAVMKFSCSNITSMTCTYVPKGWSVVISLADRSVSITAPESESDTHDKSGEVVFYGSSGSNSAYAYLTMGITDTVALDDESNNQMANCLVITEPNKFYTFSPKYRGESLDESVAAPAKCKILWRTGYSPISCVRMMEDGDIGFYSTPDFDDVDNDGDKSELVEGNALIAAVDSNDNVLWTWHIWITKAGFKSSVPVGGVTFMDRNIGAFDNSNYLTIDEEIANSLLDEDDADMVYYYDKIMKSYGMYYQWGRKDPFIYPYLYNAAGSVDATLYDGNGTYTPMEIIENSSSCGTLAYATQNPNHFILGNSGSGYDWCYGANVDDLWGADGEKSIYDPSPRGWRVPASSDFDVFTTVDTSQSLTSESYGMRINNTLFMGLGLRTYIDGKIQNYGKDSYFPWSGYYWSRDTDGSGAKALHLWYNSTEETSGFEVATIPQRANGMQIRCVKM